MKRVRFTHRRKNSQQVPRKVRKSYRTYNHKKFKFSKKDNTEI